MEQSTSGETAIGNEIPQFPGRDLASSGCRLMFLEAFLRQVQTVCLSAEVVAVEARFDAPAQQVTGGSPLPLFKYLIQGCKSFITSLHEIAASEDGSRTNNMIRKAAAMEGTIGIEDGAMVNMRSSEKSGVKTSGFIGQDLGNY